MYPVLKDFTNNLEEKQIRLLKGVCVCVCVSVCMCVYMCDMAYMWRSENNLMESDISFLLYVGIELRGQACAASTFLDHLTSSLVAFDSILRMEDIFAPWKT